MNAQSVFFSILAHLFIFFTDSQLTGGQYCCTHNKVCKLLKTVTINQRGCRAEKN